jgi:multimeric flavodoxin WrbA
MATSYQNALMPRLLVVHHTPSPGMQEMLEAVLTGARDDAIEGVEVLVRPALSASVSDALDADGFLLGSPANIGYISGALKHFFDTIYYPCLEATKGRPFAAYLHGNLGTEGAERAIESITTGLGWRAVAPVYSVQGAVTRTHREALVELGGTVAATLT